MDNRLVDQIARMNAQTCGDFDCDAEVGDATAKRIIALVEASQPQVTDTDNREMVERVRTAIRDAGFDTWDQARAAIAAIYFPNADWPELKRLAAQGPEASQLSGVVGALPADCVITMRGSSNNGCTTEIKFPGSGRGLDASLLAEKLKVLRDSAALNNTGGQSDGHN